MSWWSDLTDISGYLGGFTGTDVGGGQNAVDSGIPQAVATDTGFWGSITGFAGSVTSFFTALADGRLWASIGWILAGVVLIVLGVALWLKREAPAGLSGLPVPVPV